MKKTFFAILFYLASLFGANLAAAENVCRGKFMNPITDICWSCAFPMRVAGAGMIGFDQEDNDSSPGGVLCNCGENIGVTLGFWEPVRVIEVAREPYCFPSLGGLKLDIDINADTSGMISVREGAHGRTKRHTAQPPMSFYQAHWYINPIWFWLEVLLDHPCLESGVFDLAYFTEVDPLWHDSKKTFLINPEAVLFGNMVAQLACPFDCTTATLGFPLTELFWCAGCQGSMFPLNGWVSTHYGGVRASSLIVARMLTKMHREGLIFSGAGKKGMCGIYWDPIMNKRNYKTQLVYPVPATQKIAGKCCQPIGRTTMHWQPGKEIPIAGEDFAYQIFRKRDCCSGGFPLSDVLSP
jgi:conjugal transfer pilus assembly protein TraU